MYLTTKNASEYVGKVLDAHNRRCKLHYYPLTVFLATNGRYMFEDRIGTCMFVPDENDKFNAVFFDIVKGDGASKIETALKKLNVKQRAVLEGYSFSIDGARKDHDKQNFECFGGKLRGFLECLYVADIITRDDYNVLRDYYSETDRHTGELLPVGI